MIKHLLTIPALAATLALGAHAAEPLKKGDTIPAIELRTVEDKPVNLRDLVAQKPTVLIWYRGGWCPFCNRHLSALVDIQEDLKAAGYQMLAIGIDQPSKLPETVKRDSLNYTLLSDADAKGAEAFGIAFKVPDDLVKKYKESYKIDLEAASGRTHHKLPYPSVFVVGQDGVIRFAYVNEDYKVRLEPAKILAAAKAAQE